MPRTRAGHTIGDWFSLAQRVTPEATAGVPHLEHLRVKLQGQLDEIQKLVVERDFLEARKQEVTQRMTELLPEGRRLATTLRNALKQHFGIANEKLVEFGIQPFRGRKKRSRQQDAGDSPET